jgi:integrase/recombinase XerC
MGSDLFLEYLKFEKRYSEHTVRAYIDDLDQFNEFNRQKKSDFDFETDTNYIYIRNWIVELHQTGHAARTINRKLSALKKYCKYLIISGHINKNPFDKIIAPKSRKRLPSFLNFDEITALDETPVFQNDYTGMRDRAIIELLYCTGMRLSELINLGSGSIDLHSCTLKVKGKRNKERIIPFPKELLPVLKDYQYEKEKMGFSNLFLFTTIKGEKTYPRMIQRIVKKYLDMISTSEKKSPHVLRHTYATHLLNNGAEINAIKELLGHANLSATQVYTHNTFQKLNKIYKLAHPRA